MIYFFLLYVVLSTGSAFRRKMSRRMRLLEDDRASVRCRESTCHRENSLGEAMRYHSLMIPEDFIFHRSPKVTIETDDNELSVFVGCVMDERGGKQWAGAQKWQCFTRKASVKQRDGHLERLKGVMVLEKILRWAQESCNTEYEVYLCGQVRIPVGLHVC